MRTIIMPRLDLDMERGTVLEWLKKKGDEVKQGEPIVEIMSEKVTYEVESPASGVLYEVLVPPDTEVPIGQVIGVIMEPGDEPTVIERAVREARESLAELAAVEEPEIKREVRVAKREEVAERKPERIKISPLAKKLAEQYGIDVAGIKGTGPGGRIVKEDVLRAAEELKARVEERAEVIPLTGVRKVVAERMASSFRTAPHAILMVEVDMSEAVKLRQAFEKTKNVEISYNAIFVKAVATALREYPILNSTLEENQIKILKNINVGVAVATERGLIVPVIHDADEKSLADLTSTIAELVERARLDRLSMGDVTGGTFTITNLGMFGVDAFIAIINPKQAAILAIGRIADEPKVVNGQIAIQPTMTLSLSFDHRIIDGAPAAQFLSRIKEILENPSLLVA
ncbi:MAG: dihydrolipoamide acetyltransferase family protein [Candidatus Bathyarchaeia archaeon]